MRANGHALSGGAVRRHRRRILPAHWEVWFVDGNTEDLTDAGIAWADMVMTGGHGVLLAFTGEWNGGRCENG